MRRQAIRGLVMFGLVALAVSVAGAQTTSDTIEVRNRKDGTVKTVSGWVKLTPNGYQVFSGEKQDKPSGEVFPLDDLVRVTAVDLPGVEQKALTAVRDKEKGGKDYEAVQVAYKGLVKAGMPESTKRYIDFKVASLGQKAVDELDPGKEWQDKADAAVGKWKDFVGDYTKSPGWELWPAARTLTRVQVERGKFDEAAQSWARVKAVGDLPTDAKLEAALQEVELQIRSKVYPNAAGTAAELQKTATGARKERLAIYALAAKAGSDGKLPEGVKAIEAEMAKTKDPSVHATGYAMMGELYLAAGKPRDAMWMFLWVETVVNQDRDEVFKALTRLAELFEAQMDEDQAKKYRDKIKRARTTF